MAMRIPLGRSSGAFAASSSLRQAAAGARWRLQTTRAITSSCSISTRPCSSIQSQRIIAAAAAPSSSSFHTFAARRKSDDNNLPGDQPPPTDFGALDVLGNTPVPSTSVDICMWSGFQLNNGTRVTDGSGVLLVGGEAFSWRPWEAKSSSSSSSSSSTTTNNKEGSSPFRLLNEKGQWDVDASTLGLLGVIWPRPDLLVLGLGREMRPLSPELRRAISALGMRVEVLDTRNAAAQFNLLATERGVDDVAAALIPIGWREGVGAGTEDEPDVTHE
ncbi:NADH dehydrogenase [Apiospora phragmitis]|uniref:NADH dehydrogenase n=1 Tax=Apiospora phragmitis TaxID=2905665 RepID=A0ABR1VZL7_9PEZI